MFNSPLCLPTFPAETSSEPASSKSKCHRIAAIVALEFGVERIEIESITRGSPAAALARQVAMYLAHVVLGFGFAEIGRCFGRDRTTVVHTCCAVEDRRDDAQFDGRIAVLELACRAENGDER